MMTLFLLTLVYDDSHAFRIYLFKHLAYSFCSLAFQSQGSCVSLHVFSSSVSILSDPYPLMW